MGKVLNFPANKIEKGTHTYWPEMGERKTNCEMEARLGHYGNHYYIDTPLELKGRGITYLETYKPEDLTPQGQRKVGWNHYKVTTNAYNKLEKQYSISQERLLD